MAYCGPRGIALSDFLQWQEDDQQAALAWQADQSERCSHCGTAEWEWVEDPNAYATEVRVCRGCNLRGHEERSLQRNKTAEHMPGIYVRLVKPGGDDDGQPQH